MKIEFKIDVSAPAAQVGKAGEVKEVDDRSAKILIKGNYATEVKPAKKAAAKKKVAKKKKK